MLGTQPLPMGSRLIVNGRRIVVNGRHSTVPIPPGKVSLVLQGPQLAMQIASKSLLRCSDSETQALRYHGNVRNVHGDKKGPGV